MDLSVVIPLFNEEESLPELHTWIARVVNNMGIEWEVIFVDDGSKDTSWQVIEGLAANDSHVKGIQFQRNHGKSAALQNGFETSSGRVVITMDADLQDSPDEIPELYKMIRTDGFDIVSGWKKRRYDPISKTVPSKFFNGVTRMMSGIKIHDFNCGLKAYDGEVIRNVEVYGEMHRYIPVLAKYAGFSNITEKVVEHRKRQYGVTKFGLERFVNGFLDMLSVTFVGRFGKQPMHLFGTLGSLSFLGGGFLALYIMFEKLYNQSHGLRVREATEQPLFYVALIAVVVGVQLFLAGFLAELVSRNSPDRNKYLIKKRI
jgi:glycosyltransferase involved in cell wall biosynthesis